MEDFQLVKTHSMIEERTVMYEWKIDQFFSMMQFSIHTKNYSTIQSPDFSTNNKPGDSTWYLQTNLHNNSCLSYQEMFSITLTYYGGPQNLRAKYSICIIDSEKNKQCEQKGNYTFDKSVGYAIQPSVQLSELFKNTDKLVPGDTLTVSLELTEFIVRSNTIPPITKLRLIKSKEIVEDLVALFHSKEGSDAVLVVGDKKIPAHKTLLMNRSNVFRKMLTCHQKNNKNDEVNIPDMNSDLCEKLLEFIYTNNVTNVDEVAGRLYEVADKYQLPALKKLCEESFRKNVNVENAVQYLVLLNRHNANEDFLNYIADFIAINSKIITETEEYKALLNTNPALLLTVTTKICNLRKNRKINILENQYCNIKWMFLILLLSVLILNFGLNLNLSTFFSSLLSF
ncbi:speckle-type POZ protein-like [Microplitis mediator]|uniref:speckle-type POZ protein-like n=1 Tax=Microplitis mediator TaxID=375433 RepID=UPI00255706A8|nr:speckle-type POZ protein-like [Microplitis mediator]